MKFAFNFDSWYNNTYIVRNGLMKDLSVLQESPFTDKGSVSELFTDLNVWKGIRGVINSINKNALFAS